MQNYVVVKAEDKHEEQFLRVSLFYKHIDTLSLINPYWLGQTVARHRPDA